MKSALISSAVSAAVLAAASLVSAPSLAQVSAPAQERVEPTPQAGRKAYTSFCVRCHGINLVVGSSAYYYRDEIVRTPAGLKLQSRLCVYDSEMIANSVIYPI